MSESSSKKSPFFLKPAFIFLSVILLALGCSKTDQDVSGEWLNVKSAEILEFNPKGTGVFMYPQSQNDPLTFSWKRTATNKYVLDVDFMGTRKILTATLDGKSLGIESALGKEQYKRYTSK